MGILRRLREWREDKDGVLTGPDIDADSISTDTITNNPNAVDGITVTNSVSSIEGTVAEFTSLSAFDNTQGNFIISTDEAYYRLQSLSYDSGTNTFIGSDSGLENYPTVGAVHSLFWLPANGSEDPAVSFYWGHSSTTQREDGYVIEFDEENGAINLKRRDGNTVNTLSTKSISYSIGSWYESRILHESNGDLTVGVYENGKSNVALLTANDGTYITNGEYDHNAIGIYTFRKGWFADSWRILR